MPGYMDSFKPDAKTGADGSPQAAYMKSFRPDAEPAAPEVIAHAAADMTQPQAAKTLDIADKTDAAPAYVAAGLDAAAAAHDKQKFTDQLQGRPAMSAWAAQSPQHAALLKPDAEAAGKTEGWLSGMGDALVAGVRDIAQAEAMRNRMNPGGGWDYLGSKAFDLEDESQKYDSQDHGYLQQLARALPQMAMYAAAEKYGGSVGVAGLLYAQNKGVLARQIELAQPKDDRPWQFEYNSDGSVSRAFQVGAEPKRLTPDEIDNYAIAGSAASAVTLAGLLGPLLRSMPGVRTVLQGTVDGALSRAAATTVGQAALRSILAWGKHTAMGAVGMALQHTINSGVAQQAATGDVDWMQLGRETGSVLVKVLPIAATFGAYGPMREYLTERGRLNMAPTERAKLDAMVEQAKKMQMAKTAPDRLADLFGEMGRGVKVFIDHLAAKKMTGLPPGDVAAAEVAQDAVAVPVGDYLAHLADQHEAVKDDVKLDAKGYTMNEARARDKELRGALPEDVAKALLGKQTPDEILQFGQPEQKSTEAPPAAKVGKVSETVTLYRGTRGRDPSVPGRAGARFMSPDPAIAEGYASGDNTTGPAVGEGKVSKEQMHFENILKAENFEAVKEKLGFESGKPVGSEDVLNRAREKGYDALSYKSAELTGPVYVDLMNWLHELVKQYGGTVEKWQDRLTPELVAALKEEGSKGAVAAEEHASRVVEAMQVRDIDPERFERLAKKSSKYIQEAAEKARTGSVGAAKAYSPADVAILSTHELARDVNLAKAAKASAVRAEMDQISDTFAKQSKNDKLRALLNRAGSPLLHLFDALTERTGSPDSVFERKGWAAAHQEAVEAGAEPFSADATQYADARMKGSLGEAKQWFEDMARPFPANEKVVEKFLSNPRSLGELRPAEVRVLADFVNQLTKTAREENTVRRKDSEATVAEVTGEIRGELRQNPSKGLPLPSGVPSNAWRDLKLDANAANAVQLRPKNNLRQKSAAAVKWIFDRINDAVYDRDAFFREVGELWKTAFEAMPKEIAKRRFETYDLSDKLPVQGTEPYDNVPRQFLWKLGQHRMSQGNMERVTSTSGWDVEAIDHILFDDPKTKLTVPEWDYLQSLADVKEKYIWSRLKAHFEKFYGMAPSKTAGRPFRVQLEDGTFKDYAGGYEPLKRDARTGVAPQPEPTKGIAQYWGKDFQIPWMPGSAKERTDGAHYLVNMDWDSSRASVANTLHWLAFDQPVRDVAKLLNDPGLAADMNEFMGEGRADMTRGWLKSAATRQAQSIPEGMEIVGKVFGWQRRMMLMRIVGGSARLAVAQLSHPIGLMLGGEVNPIHGIPAFLSTFKPMTMADGEVRLFPNWNDAILHGREVQHRADNAYYTLRRTWDQVGPGNRSGPLGALATVAQRTAGLYLHAVDRLTTSWAWTAFHNEAVAKGMEPFSEEAIAHADGKTQDVMPVHDVETAAPILTNRQIGGFLVMHGFKNTLYNFRQDALAASVKDFHLADSPKEYGSAIAKTTGRVALQTAMFGGFAIMGKLALGYGQQEDESKGQWLARDFMAGQSVDVPFVGGLGEPLAKMMVGGHVTRRDFTLYGNPGMAVANEAYDLLGKLVSEGREDYKKVFDALETVLFVTGSISRPLRVTAEHIYEMLMGEGYDNPDQSDEVGRMFYNEKQWDSVKRSLTPDED